jgi:hypothetical protein
MIPAQSTTVRCAHYLTGLPVGRYGLGQNPCYLKEPGAETMSKIQKKFSDICVKISLNVPPHCSWCWDEVFGTALVVFDRSDMDLVYIPMTLEFDAQWDMASIDKAPPHFSNYFNRVFGIMPGQKIFTTADSSGLILFAVWWPWGDGAKISLRVGLFSPAEDRVVRHQIKALLTDWFHL